MGDTDITKAMANLSVKENIGDGGLKQPVNGGSTSSDISLTSTESSSSSPSSGHYGQLAREMSKPLIITADQSMTSTSTDVTLNTTGPNTSDSNENLDEKRRRVKPETIVEGQALSSASEGELAEAERVRMQLQRMHAKDQEITDRRMRYGWSHWSNEASVADHGDGVGSHRNGHGPIRLDHEDSAAAAGYMRGYRQDSRGTYIPYPTFQENYPPLPSHHIERPLSSASNSSSGAGSTFAMKRDSGYTSMGALSSGLSSGGESSILSNGSGGCYYPNGGISSAPGGGGAPAVISNSPVELQVTNLDQSVDQKEMKMLIAKMFRMHVGVMHVSTFFQSDGNLAACVRVPSLNEAQYAISKLHRAKIGYKRILISYSHNHTQNPVILRSKVVALLGEVPGAKLQLFKFREMFEKRYHASIGVSDLYKMKECVIITEEQSGRMVQLSGTAGGSYNQLQPSPGFGSLTRVLGRSSSGGFLEDGTPGAVGMRSSGSGQNLDILEAPFCVRHSPQAGDGQGWAERENGAQLPIVNASLQVLAPNLRKVVSSHGGNVPLATIVACYEAEFEPLPVDPEEGVPLEHLVSCVKGVLIQQGVTGIKSIIAVGGGGGEDDALNSSHSGSMNSLVSTGSGFHSGASAFGGIPLGHPGPAQPLAGQLALFSRELVDLLKSHSGCRMPFHKFIPSYHHHFGRQCRVADYGYTKLKELFEALPHVVQIMGEGSRAMITLSHRAQIKRFTSDLLRVLKTQATKQVSVTDLPGLFSKITARTFKICDYGVCDLEDLLLEISETSVVLTTIDDELMVAIPKREQTLDEVERTHQFAQECVELLRHAPDCRLPFNKFIPSYHHHFGRQCRVSDYGFNKLIELFEAVPGTVEVTEDPDGERLLQLTDSERLSVVAEQIATLVKSSRRQSVQLDHLTEMYSRQFGYQLRPENHGKTTLVGLMKSLSTTLRLEGDGDEIDPWSIRLIDRSYIKALSIQVRSILLQEEKAGGKMEIGAFKEKFQKSHNAEIDVPQLKSDLPDLVEIIEEGDESAPSKDKDGKKEKKDPDSKDEAKPGSSEDSKCKKEKAVLVRLLPIQLCAARIESLIKDFDGKLYCSELEATFVDKYKAPLYPGQFGFPSVNTLIGTGLAKFFVVKGRGTRKIICPLKEGAGSTEYRGSFGFSAGSSFRFNSPDRRGFSTGGEDGVAAAAAITSVRTPSYGSGAHFNSTLESSRPYYGGGGAVRHYERNSGYYGRGGSGGAGPIHHHELATPYHQAGGGVGHHASLAHYVNNMGRYSGGGSGRMSYLDRSSSPQGRSMMSPYEGAHGHHHRGYRPPPLQMTKREYVKELDQFGIYPYPPSPSISVSSFSGGRYPGGGGGGSGVGLPAARLSVSPSIGSPIAAAVAAAAAGVASEMQTLSPKGFSSRRNAGYASTSPDPYSFRAAAAATSGGYSGWPESHNSFNSFMNGGRSNAANNFNYHN